MADETRDAGLLQVMAERFEKQRLPVVLGLKEKIDRGDTSKNSTFDFSRTFSVMRSRRVV